MEASVQWFDPSLGTPVVSVSKTGLTFNRAAVALLGNPRYVEVGVDGKARVIVVREAEPEPGRSAEPSRGLTFWRPDSDKPFVRVTSKDLVRFIEASVPDFSPAGATKYLARFEPQNGHLVVDLRQPVGSRRRKSRR